MDNEHCDQPKTKSRLLPVLYAVASVGVLGALWYFGASLSTILLAGLFLFMLMGMLNIGGMGSHMGGGCCGGGHGSHNGRRDDNGSDKSEQSKNKY